MRNNSKNTGTAIAIAWPETLCKQPGSWYDAITIFLGINKNHYYKVGHAAIVLVDHKTKNAFYYDFGRYHTPYQYGRVRSEITDRDLKIKSKILIKRNELINVDEILNEISKNNSCHGEGVLIASQSKIDFSRAQKKAEDMQMISPIPYGPFIWYGTNCSRFVKKVLLSGLYSFQKRVLLKLAVSPTPMWNVQVIGKQKKNL